MIELILLAVLLALNGFFVAVEFAAVASRRARIDQMAGSGSRGARIVQGWLSDHANRDRLIAGAQLGITVASLALGIVGENAFDSIMNALFAGAEVSPTLSTIITGLPFVLSLVIVSALHVVFGEQIPKVACLRAPERVAVTFALPMQIFNTIFRPFVALLNWSSSSVLRLFGLETIEEHSPVYSLEELRQIMRESEESGILHEDEHDIIDAVLDIRDLLTRQVMVPRTEIDMLNADIKLDDIIKHVVQTPHNKFPVYDKDPDDIIGILYVKDLLAPQEGASDARALCTEALFVPETLPVVKLLELLRASGKHIAIVHDEFGGTEGMVTLDDVLGKIVGELPDRYEYNLSDNEVKVRGDDYVVSGLMLIEDFNEEFDLQLSDANYNTIGGYVMGRLERVPQVGDTVELAGYILRVEAMDALRIDQLSLTKTPTAPSQDAEQEDINGNPSPH